MRAATPATILVLAACILLVLVTCSTPVIKSLAFLEATIGGAGNEAGQKATLGALGYCIGSTCRGPTIGYSFDPTQLLGVATSVEGFSVDSSKYSSAVIKGLTYALVLNPVALAACVITLITGLLAHCGDMSLICINGLFSGLASGLAFIACAINFALFVLAQKRINAIDGASAKLGIALWLSLAGWILIVLSSCAFCCGCGGRGGGGRKSRKSLRDEPHADEDAWKSPSRFGGPASYSDQMRMDALQAERDRKTRQKDLPRFATYTTEHVEELPLKEDYEDGYGGGSMPTHQHHNVAGYGGGYHDDSSYGHGPQGAYAAGVGPGALRNGRGEQPAETYYDPASMPNSHNNLAGYGAHDLTSPTTMDASQMDVYGHAVGTPMNMPLPAGAAGHGYGASDNYFHGAEHSGEADGYGGYARNLGPLSPAGYGASSYNGMPHNQGQAGAPTTSYENAAAYDTHYNGQEQYDGRGVVDHGALDGSAAHADYASPPTSATPYDAVSRATSAGRSRRLPTVPGVDERGGGADGSASRHRNNNSSFGARHIPPPAQATGDDGFGVAVLQAGADAANQHSDDNYLPADAPPDYGHGASGYGGYAGDGSRIRGNGY